MDDPKDSFATECHRPMELSRARTSSAAGCLLMQRETAKQVRQAPYLVCLRSWIRQSYHTQRMPADAHLSDLSKLPTAVSFAGNASMNILIARIADPGVTSLYSERSWGCCICLQVEECACRSQRHIFSHIRIEPPSPSQGFATLLKCSSRRPY